MTTGTSVIDVEYTDGATVRVEWNGNPEDRARAREAFETAVGFGALASVWTAPRESVHVRSFDQVEEIERERGTVEVTVRPRVVGG